MKILVADEKCTVCKGTGFVSTFPIDILSESRVPCSCVHAVDLRLVRAAIGLLDEGVTNVEVNE